MMVMAGKMPNLCTGTFVKSRVRVECWCLCLLAVIRIRLLLALITAVGCSFVCCEGSTEVGTERAAGMVTAVSLGCEN